MQRMGSDSKRVFGAGRQGLLVVRSTDLGLEITGSTVCGCVIVSSQRTPAHQSLPSSAVVRKLYLPPVRDYSFCFSCLSELIFLRFKFNEPMSVNPVCMLQNANECIVFLFRKEIHHIPAFSGFGPGSHHCHGQPALD